jgi:nuclear pore complex protein Nup50
MDSTSCTSDSRSPEYYSNLKGLNQCVSRWIKSHVDSNPFCILTPIFRDYELYLTEIDKKESKLQREEKADPLQRRGKSPEKSAPTSTTEGTVTEGCVYTVLDAWIMSVCLNYPM